MIVLGVETSCDECAASVVENGTRILSEVVASQIEDHRPFYGVVPEIASRRHIETISRVVEQVLEEAKMKATEVDGLAVTYQPGLIGSLLVGLSFTKGLAFALEKPLVGVDHILAHLYAPHLETDISYPYIGLLVSGGHTVIARVEDFDTMRVLGTTIDDACGEAFDKVAKHYDMGFPGGAAIDRLSQNGSPQAFRFPWPSLHKGHHPFDLSYSGLKTAVVNQLDQFWNRDFEKSKENIAASFQGTAIDILVDRTVKAAGHTGLNRIVVGGGVAANSYLRKQLSGQPDLEVNFPSLRLCTDNAAMVAGLGYHMLRKGQRSELSLNACARVQGLRRLYP
ncbi:MAG: tRNA (adenosine(37)-N6)-threonylcarbamoyltransferase complex transferase subunit TsaD [Spirochaetia bacterium]|jgi:N6-L-threonylcarbamoyladenine synthase|nr:tRNA (adenosine(37)-N6)-threonylcarbamoyltransferase complex transferase subunit TsaD [Spirochaetales bacterium]